MTATCANENQYSLVNPVTPAGVPVDPANAAHQATANTALANILAKLIAAPATAANQSTAIGHLAALAGLVTGGGQLATRPREVGSVAELAVAIAGIAEGEQVDVMVLDSTGLTTLQYEFTADVGGYGGARLPIGLGADDAAAMANWMAAVSLVTNLVGTQADPLVAAGVIASTELGATVTVANHGAGHITPMPGTDSGLAEISMRTTESILADILAAQQGTGLPIPLALADPAGDGYSAALSPNPITRACARLRVLVGNSGCVLSFDGGTTSHYTLPADMAEDIALAIPSGSDVRVKRATAGTAITGLIVEVR